MLTLMKGSLFVQMEEDGIEERDDSVKDLVIIIMVLLVMMNVMLLVVVMTVIMVMVMLMVMGTVMIMFESASPVVKVNVKFKVDITMKKMDGDKDGRVSFADYSEMVSLCLTIVCPLSSFVHSCHDKGKDERFCFVDFLVMVSLRLGG